jgi:hypothetical protein
MVANFLWNPGTSNVGLTATAFTLMADTSELASLTSTSYVVSSVSGTSGVLGTAVSDIGCNWFGAFTRRKPCRLVSALL